MSKVLAHLRKPPGGGLFPPPPIPFRVKSCASKVSRKKIGSQKYNWKYFKLKSTAIVHQPHKIQQLGPVPKSYRFLNSPPPPQKCSADPCFSKYGNPPLGFAANIFKSFPVAGVDAAKILVLVVHKCAKSHRQTCNSYKKPLIVCGYSDLSILGSVISC